MAELNKEYEIVPVSKFSFGAKELLRNRELLYFFIWRDIKIRYKQTLLGIAWVILQPLLLMMVFSYVLAARFNQDLNGIDYGTFVLGGLLMWNIFSSALANAGQGMVSNANIIKKIYFPRLIIPLSAVAVSLFDFLFAAIIYIVVLIYYQTPFHFTGLLFLLPALVLTATAALGSGSLIAALNVKYRDFRYILPFLIQTMMFVTPVFYPICSSCGISSYLFALNPMYAPVQLFRMHLEGSAIQAELIGISIAFNLILLMAGLIVFRKMESYFADIA